MKLLLFILFALFHICTAWDSKIVGGTEVDDGDVPYIVSIRFYNQHGCGGSIISEKYILTAAHCVNNWIDKVTDLSIQHGTVNISPAGPNVIKVKNVLIHEDYDNDSPGYICDLAILELAEEIEYGPFTLPIRLPNLTEFPEDASVVHLTGWGLLETGGKPPTHLQSVSIMTFPDEYCKILETRFDPKYHFCGGVLGGGSGQCTGDSGGPAVVDGTLYGVISWSVKPCASPDNPGIFVRIPNFRLWIYEKTGV